METESEFIAEKSLPTGTERILFIDDEKVLVRMGRKMLEGLGYEVATETDSLAALERFKTGSPENQKTLKYQSFLPTPRHIVAQVLALSGIYGIKSIYCQAQYIVVGSKLSKGSEMTRAV